MNDPAVMRDYTLYLLADPRLSICGEMHDRVQRGVHDIYEIVTPYTEIGVRIRVE